MQIKYTLHKRSYMQVFVSGYDYHNKFCLLGISTFVSLNVIECSAL